MKIRNLISTMSLLLLLVGSSCLNAQEIRGTGALSTLECEYVWRQAVPGDNIGKNSMHAGDYDGDGRMEILCGASTQFDSRINYWYMLEYVPERKSFDQVWVSPFYSSSNGMIIVIEVLDIDGDGHPEILTGNDKSEVQVYDAATRNQKGTFLLPSWDDELVHSIVFADADNDGNPELACCTNNATYFMNPDDFSFKGKIWTGATSMMCANVDADPEVELVYSNGRVEQVGAGYTHSTWKFRDVPLHESPAISLFDIDADGMDEIFYVADSVWVYDADLQTVRMILSNSWYSFDAIQVADMNLDGALEIYAGTQNNIHVYDSAGVKMDEFPNVTYGVTGFLADDLNSDGSPDLMWGTGNHSTEYDYLVIYNPLMDSLLWKSPGLASSFAGVKTADTDGDGNNEIITFTESGPLITMFDAGTHTIEWQSSGNLMPGSYDGGKDFEIADVDYDGDIEIILASDISYDANLWAFNCRTLEIESNHVFPELERFHALEIIDADNNGELEYVVAGSSTLYYINPIDYSVTWTSPDMGFSSWTYQGTLKTGNTDADYNKEIVWLAVRDIFVFDAFTKVYKRTEDGLFSSVCLFDYDRDGISEIIAGTYDGRLAVLDGHSLEITWLPVSFGSKILSLGVFDVPGKETPVFALITDGMLYFTDAAGNKFSPIILGSEYELNYGIEITDYDNNGISEIFVVYNEMITEFSADSFRSVGMPEDNMVTSGCSVRPNPSDGIFKIEIDGEFSGQVFVEIYSLQGIRVATATLSGNYEEIDLGGFPSGIYLLHINSGDQVYHLKLVKN